MSSVSILSYLHYLHDVNRKLLQRGGLENVLYRKPVSQHPYYHQLDQPDPTRPRHWLGSLRHIQNAEARGAALRPLVGIGLVVGQIETDKGKKRLAAPLAFCNVELVEDERRPNSVDMQTLWDSVALNYDLLTLFLGQIQEDEGDESGFQQTGVHPKTLAILTEVENDLEKFASDTNPESRLTPNALAALMKHIRDNVPEFGSVSTSTTPYDHRLLDALVQRRPPMFFPHRFFFIAPAAGELSTMMALAELIRQSERRRANAV